MDDCDLVKDEVRFGRGILIRILMWVIIFFYNEERTVLVIGADVEWSSNIVELGVSDFCFFVGDWSCWSVEVDVCTFGR